MRRRGLVLRTTEFLSDEQELAVRSAIRDGATRDQAAAAAGITVSQLVTRLKDQLSDVRVGQGRRGNVRNRPDPSAEEIAAACAKIRARWDEQTRSERSLFFNGTDSEG